MRGAGQGAQDAFGIGAVGGLPSTAPARITVVSADSRQRRQALGLHPVASAQGLFPGGADHIVGGAFARVLGFVLAGRSRHLQHLVRHAHLGQQLAAPGLADAR